MGRRRPQAQWMSTRKIWSTIGSPERRRQVIERHEGYPFHNCDGNDHFFEVQQVALLPG